MILNLLRGAIIPYFHKSNANFYRPIEPPKDAAFQKWPQKNFGSPNERSLFRSTHAAFRNLKSMRLTKILGKAKFVSLLSY